MHPFPFSPGVGRHLHLLHLLTLTVLLAPDGAAWAQPGRQVVCCRTSGGTRSSCPNHWAHLVPPENRFNPGSARQVALFQGVAEVRSRMTVRLTTTKGQLISEHLLEPQPTGVKVLTLPEQTPSSVLWESFPNCAPDRPPTTTLLDQKPSPTDGSVRTMMRRLSSSCGGFIDTDELLRTFNMESLRENLPEALPISCEVL